MKLYTNPLSQNCRRVAATLLYNGQSDVEIVPIDFMKGEHKTPEFLALNPNGKLPTLVDGDYVLWESTAIMQYLSQDSSLWPKSKVRYDITRWQVWAVAHFGRAASTIVFERMLKKAFGMGEPDEATVAEAVGHFTRFATVLNDHLDGRTFIVGDDVTLADFSVASELTYAGPAELPLAGFDNLNAWYARIEALDAWKQSAPPTHG